MSRVPMCGACRTRPCKRKPSPGENDVPLYYEWCASCRDLAGLDQLGAQLDVRERQLDAVATARREGLRHAAQIPSHHAPRRRPHPRKAAVGRRGSSDTDVKTACTRRRGKREIIDPRDTLARYMYAAWAAARGGFSLDYALRRHIVNDPTPEWATDIAYAMWRAPLSS